MRFPRAWRFYVGTVDVCLRISVGLLRAVIQLVRWAWDRR
jgi:hypothetical protein